MGAIEGHILDTPHFSEAVCAWFSERFEEPTDVQLRTWSLVASGKNVLSIAPTGSGKTLAAFLWAIDDLAFRDDRRVGDGASVLYISPLKALAVDVDRNLRVPLAGISDKAGELGLPIADVTIGMRTGDTTPEERRALVRKPPDILITTPESLYLMLTSKARETLRNVRTVIVDEIHSLAGSKRGAHLALSLERLDDLLEEPAQRIGLSATVRPPEVVANFLGGCHPVEIVAQDSGREFHVSVEVPVADMTAIPPRAGAIGSSSIWPYVEQAVLDEVLSHKSTIVFVNSRGLCERFTARLNEMYAKRIGNAVSGVADIAGGTANRSSLGSTSEFATGADAVIAKAHHGSVSKERRQAIERELKSGELPCVVATSSLELGIDMGAVDLVIQLAPPPSVSSALQRIGRANHSVGGISQGLMFPLVRTEVIGCAVAAEGMMEGAIEKTRIMNWPLDVLAQQTVAQVSMENTNVDAWFLAVTRSANYSGMPRAAYDSVIAMLAGAYSAADDTGFAARIRFDKETGELRALSGAQRLAVGGAGTIPDRGSYPVVLAEGTARKGRKRVGELDEEMVYESRVGDVITLGTSVWRIKQITGDRVVVEPAPGRGSRLPFWHGERAAREFEDGLRRGAFLSDADAGVLDSADLSEIDRRNVLSFADERFLDRLMRAGLNENAQRNLIALIAEQRRCTGVLPSDKTLVVEKCAEESGGLRIILHSPFGRRVHEPWALAVSQRIMAEYGFDPKVMAGDDGIVVLTPSAEEFDIPAEIFAFDSDEIADIVRQSVTGTSLFAARFRECAARALLMRPQTFGKRAPLWLQRVKAGQLLEAARHYGDFPMMIEAMRECMQDVYDMSALQEVMQRIDASVLRLVEVQTDSPSPFAGPLLFSYVGEHLYDGDMPHAERAAAILSIDSELLTEVLGSVDMGKLLDVQVLSDVEAQLQRLTEGRHAKDAQDIADMLRALGPLSQNDIALRAESSLNISKALDGLKDDKLAFSYADPSGEKWAVAQDGWLLRDALGIAVPDWAVWEDEARLADDMHPMDLLVSRYARTHVAFSSHALAHALGTGVSVIEDSLKRLVGERRIAQGSFGIDEQGFARAWVDKDILQRLRSRSLAKARDAVKPVPFDAYMRFLLDKQGIGSVGLLEGVDGVAEVIAQFEGIFLEAALWESEVFPARVRSYKPQLLDELLHDGDVIWLGKSEERKGSESAKKMVAFYPSDSEFAPFVEEEAFDGSSDMDIRDIIWNTAATSDSFAAVRELTEGMKLPKGAPVGRRASSRRSRRGAAFAEASRRAASSAIGKSVHSIAVLGTCHKVELSQADALEVMLNSIEATVDAYGVISADTIALLDVSGGIWSMMDVLDRMEDTGTLTRGTFVEGLGPVQFATKETVEALRTYATPESELRDGRRVDTISGEAVVLSVEDPACIFGRGVPWPEVPGYVEPEEGGPSDRPVRRSGSLVVICDGAPVLYAAPNMKHLLAFSDDEAIVGAAISALAERIQRDVRRVGSRLSRKRYEVERMNGISVLQSPYMQALSDAGFVRTTDGMRLYADPF